MYEKLFSPGAIGTLTIPNRIVMTAASASLSQPDGTMTEDMLAYYEARAKGGVGLIITEMVCVDEARGVLFPRELNAAREDKIPAFRALAERVHPYGTKIFAQLFHPGANADPKLNPHLPWSPPATAGGRSGGRPRRPPGRTSRKLSKSLARRPDGSRRAGWMGWRSTPPTTTSSTAFSAR